jgi:hypothetical protein
VVALASSDKKVKNGISKPTCSAEVVSTTGILGEPQYFSGMVRRGYCRNSDYSGGLSLKFFGSPRIPVKAASAGSRPRIRIGDFWKHCPTDFSEGANPKIKP